MRQHRLETLAAGADLHLPKPITAVTLVEGVFEALQVRDAPKAAKG